jgi:hypothetical protein
MRQTLIALDQLVNTLCGGFADETISSRCWRLRYRQPYKALRAVIDGLFFFDGAHCKASYQSERLRAQLPPELRRRKR